MHFSASSTIAATEQQQQTTPEECREAISQYFFEDTTATTKNSSVSDLREAIRALVKHICIDNNNELIETRRELHQHPELMYQEKITNSIIVRQLHKYDIAHTSGWAINKSQSVFPGDGGYGIVADIGTKCESQPCILLRGDMDALPIEETTKIDFASKHRGTMHACGHDAHTSMLIGAASVVKYVERCIPGTVRFMFQPAEEGGAGAKRMIEEGVLELEPKPQCAYGMHVWPTLPSGAIGGRSGALLAACERFEIVVAGTGGHAAMPHLTRDPIVASSALVMSLQTLVSRKLSPLDSGVCSITMLKTGGDAFNVIPASVRLRGTIRALSDETLHTLRNAVHEVSNSVACAHGCSVTIQYSPDYYPPTINDPELWKFSSDVAKGLAKDGEITEVEPTMGAEDFSFLAQAIPSTFFLLGQGCGTDPVSSYGLHHPSFGLDESVLSRGVELHVNLALQTMKRLVDDRGAGLE